MPAQKAQSGLLAKYGKKIIDAHNAHKDDETTFGGGGNLPPGIEQGVARLIECKFDTYKEGDNAGEYYFYAAGAVILPKELNGVPLQGERTSIMEPVCDTPNRSRKTTDEHMKWIYNELRKLGVDTSKLNPENVEAAAAALKQAAPYFKFRTWIGKATDQYPDPRVNHDWKGMVTNFSENGDGSEGVSDGTPQWENDAAAEAEAQAAVAATTKAAPKTTTTKPAAGKAATKPTTKAASPPPTTPVETATASDDDGSDLDALGAAADDAQDQDAMVKLAGQAKLFNVDHNAAPDWRTVAEQIKEAIAAQEGEGAAEAQSEAPAEETATEFMPEVSEIYYYRPIDPKTKKPAAKAIECEVKQVFAAAKKVNLLNLVDNKTPYKSVPFDALEQGS